MSNKSCNVNILLNQKRSQIYPFFFLFWKMFALSSRLIHPWTIISVTFLCEEHANCLPPQMISYPLTKIVPPKRIIFMFHTRRTHRNTHTHKEIKTMIAMMTATKKKKKQQQRTRSNYDLAATNLCHIMLDNRPRVWSNWIFLPYSSSTSSFKRH